MPTDKEILNDQVHLLKKKGIIKFDSDLARDLNYTRGAISEILSLTSKKPVTYSFLQKFKAKYGEHLQEVTDSGDLKQLQAEIKVLRQICIELLSKSSGKSQVLIAAELDEAIRIMLNK